ncbi:AVEN regulator, partial [Odontophorus gujanensis]|nr:AVEN regulator [Odontophorus gujanensis]
QVEYDGDTESREEDYKEEVKNYSRRKIVSNWNRYEDAEKEEQRECGESQRGTDFSVLLSSAGDSFTQFRFAEEKDWDTENVYCKQLSALSVDCQSLAQALQELPLHLRLNVAAELVQASTPVELPQMKPKVVEDCKRREQFRQSLSQREMLSASQPAGDSVASPEPGTKRGPVTGAPEPLHRAQLLPKQESDHLDEELDRLLNLDAPIDSVSRAFPYNIPTEKDLKMESKENDLPTADAPEVKSTAAQQEQNTSRSVTEEELEDWLDSMIA